jgi:hypothetical protein
MKTGVYQEARRRTQALGAETSMVKYAAMRVEGAGSMNESCAKHPHEVGVALCGRCGAAWCANCLVYAHGPKKPPYCMECAMFAGGVRSAAARPALTRREMKARVKQVAAMSAAAESTATTHVESAEPAADTSPLREIASTDWSAPWWEDRQHTLAD